MLAVIKKILRSLDPADKSGARNILLKPLSMILSLVYTPLLLSYLGDEQYGLWATILSIISWLQYCDVGIGHGLRNLLVKEMTEKKYEDTKKSVSTAYLVLGAIAVGILLVLIALTLVLNWHVVFNTEIDMQLPVLISFIFISVNFLLALVNNILYALQLAEIVSLKHCAVQVLNIVGLVLLKIFAQPSLVWMSILFGITTTISYTISSTIIFKKLPYLRPNLKLFQRNKVSSISNVGMKYFAIQISCILLYTMNKLLISHYFGAEAVTPFDISDKAFNVGFTFLSALTLPYWSRTTQLLAQNRMDVLRKLIRKIYAVFGLFIVAYVALLFLFKPLARIWVGAELDYAPGLILTTCVYYILFSFVTINTSFINGSGKVNAQLVLSLAMGIINIPLSIFLGVTCGLGVVGIRLATTILMAIGAVFYPINLRSIINRAEKEASKTNTLPQSNA